MNDAITLFGNNLFILGSVGGLFFIAKWWGANHLSKDNHVLISSLSLIFIAVAFRIGWWALALSIEGTEVVAVYPEFFYGWKWAMTLVTSIIYVIGVIGLIHVIEDLTLYERIGLGVAAMVTALLFSFL